jgi:hypothetical protein
MIDLRTEGFVGEFQYSSQMWGSTRKHGKFVWCEFMEFVDMAYIDIVLTRTECICRAAGAVWNYCSTAVYIGDWTSTVDSESEARC